jgi:hypothetical protein
MLDMVNDCTGCRCNCSWTKAALGIGQKTKLFGRGISRSTRSFKLAYTTHNKDVAAVPGSEDMGVVIQEELALVPLLMHVAGSTVVTRAHTPTIACCGRDDHTRLAG